MKALKENNLERNKETHVFCTLEATRNHHWQKPYVKYAHANEGEKNWSRFCKKENTSHACLMSKRLDEEAREGNEERRRMTTLRFGSPHMQQMVLSGRGCSFGTADTNSSSLVLPHHELLFI